jgi:hypothetical protein
VIDNESLLGVKKLPHSRLLVCSIVFTAGQIHTRQPPRSFQRIESQSSLISPEIGRAAEKEADTHKSRGAWRLKG